MSVDNVPATSQRRMWYVAAGIAASVLVGVVVLVVIAVRPAAGDTRVDDTDARLSYVMPDGWRTSEGVGGFGQTSAIEVGGGLDGFDERVESGGGVAITVGGRRPSGRDGVGAGFR